MILNVYSCLVDKLIWEKLLLSMIDCVVW
jgi:hypothetical protein